MNTPEGTGRALATGASAAGLCLALLDAQPLHDLADLVFDFGSLPDEKLSEAHDWARVFVAIVSLGVIAVASGWMDTALAIGVVLAVAAVTGLRSETQDELEKAAVAVATPAPATGTRVRLDKAKVKPPTAALAVNIDVTLVIIGSRRDLDEKTIETTSDRYEVAVRGAVEDGKAPAEDLPVDYAGADDEAVTEFVRDVDAATAFYLIP